MPLNFASLCLLPPQNLLSINLSSQTVSIELSQALVQFKKALSGEESLQEITINAAWSQLTPVATTPLTKEFSTGTKLKCQQVQEFDRYMGIQRVHAQEPAKLIVANLFKVYISFLEISATLHCDHSEALVKSGFQSYANLLTRYFGLDQSDLSDLEENINMIQEFTHFPTHDRIEPNLTLSPLQTWKKGHWIFLVFSQALIISLNRLVIAVRNDQLDQAKTELKTSAELMYSSGAAMKLTGNFTREKYESEIRPTMMTGNPHSLVQLENLSGLMMWEHDYLVNIICKQKLSPIMKNLTTQLEAEHEKFVLAYKWGLSDGHKSICAAFGGGEIGSLIATGESSNALKKLDFFEQSRAKILDPMSRVKGGCPMHHFLGIKTSVSSES